MVNPSAGRSADRTGPGSPDSVATGTSTWGRRMPPRALPSASRRMVGRARRPRSRDAGPRAAPRRAHPGVEGPRRGTHHEPLRAVVDAPPRSRACRRPGPPGWHRRGRCRPPPTGGCGRCRAGGPGSSRGRRQVGLGLSISTGTSRSVRIAGAATETTRGRRASPGAPSGPARPTTAVQEVAVERLGRAAPRR